jgi:hypothetical protein
MALKKFPLEALKKLKTFINALKHHHNFPATKSCGKGDFRSSFLKLIIKVLDAGQALMINSFFSLGESRIIFKVYPIILPVRMGEFAEVDMFI